MGNFTRDFSNYMAEHWLPRKIIKLRTTTVLLSKAGRNPIKKCSVFSVLVKSISNSPLNRAFCFICLRAAISFTDKILSKLKPTLTETDLKALLFKNMKRNTRFEKSNPFAYNMKEKHA